MGEMIAPETDHHVSPPCQTGMDGILPKEETEGRIISICWHAPYGVTWIDVFQAEVKASPFEIGVDLVSEEDPDVPKANIAGGIPFSRLL